MPFSRAELADIVRGFLGEAQKSDYAFLIICMIYVAAGAVVFPVSILNLGVAMVFGPVWGTLYAICGCVLSAGLFFNVGRMIGHTRVHKFLEGDKIAKIDKGLRNGRIAGIAVLRLIPIAPFTIFNIIAGVTSVRFRDFMAGTFLSLLPGAVARGVLGDSLMQIFLEPSWQTTGYVVLGFALWFGVIIGAHLLLHRGRAQQQAA